MTTDEANEKAREQYSTHTDHDGRITTKYVTSSDGYRNGPYAYEVYYTSAGQQWNYLGPVNGVSPSAPAETESTGTFTKPAEDIVNNEDYSEATYQTKEADIAFIAAYQEELAERIDDKDDVTFIATDVSDRNPNHYQIVFEVDDTGDKYTLETGYGGNLAFDGPTIQLFDGDMRGVTSADEYGAPIEEEWGSDTSIDIEGALKSAFSDGDIDESKTNVDDMTPEDAAILGENVVRDGSGVRHAPDRSVSFVGSAVDDANTVEIPQEEQQRWRVDNLGKDLSYESDDWVRHLNEYDDSAGYDGFESSFADENDTYYVHEDDPEYFKTDDDEYIKVTVEDGEVVEKEVEKSEAREALE